MSQSLAKLYVHAIFATKGRIPCLTPGIRAELFPYLATVLNNMDCPAIEVGGAADHVHLLCMMSKSLAAGDLIKNAKTSSSKWIKTMGPEFDGFQWQAGYGVFSVSASNVPNVVQYIRHQEEHHRKISFQDEFRRFLERYRIEYDERYVWD
jgi:REP element-mobilizing transposase RayT